MGSKNTDLRKIMLFLILFIFLYVAFFPSCLALDYYADLEITVDNSGFVTIDGVTNHPDLIVENTEIYTSKQQSYWLLNITKEENFSDFVYVLTLPLASSINYVTSSGSFRIETDDNKLLIKGFGEDEPFYIRVQYQLKKTTESNDIISSNLLRIFLITIIIIIIIVTILLLIKSKYIKKPEEPRVSVEKYNFKGLNERQKDIMKLLIERKIPLTQTDIQKEIKIPKAAVSRNIRGLELKGLIEKEQIGMSNLIRLKKP